MQYKLKECRIKAGLTQQQVADQLNTAQFQIHKYETGKQEISLARAIDLADLYKVTLDELAGRNLLF
ncbi:MAG: helix-turn-helix transcriptional regulator [Oscillospiraceae bacterium]|nr:helix-turn-helix transcriptional regulator [Oscillospiraceae bacterium]